MLGDQAAAAEAMVALGASRVVVHAAQEGAQEALARLQQYRAGDYAVAVGVALRAHDEALVAQGFEGLVDYVQVMGIAHEGRQGEPFDPQALELVRALRAAYPALVIQVDGGVSAKSARALSAAGANRLVAGSAILGSDDPKGAYKAVYTEANGAQ
jgi:ribulose-phosphate 3-epimerase